MVTRPPRRDSKHEASAQASRRDVVRLSAAAAACALLPTLTVRKASATPAEMAAAIGRVTGGARMTQGRVKLDIPPLVENGNTVPCTITVQSPMTAADHVRAIHVFNEKNPQPNVISVKLGPRAGRAVVSTRIRLSDTQHVTAVAEMSDGTFWSDSVSVLITLGACLEDPI